MKLNPEYEIIEIADEYIAVPIGETAKAFHGVIALSGPTAFLLKHMDGTRSRDDLIRLLLDKYDVSEDTVDRDFNALLSSCKQTGLIIE